MIFFKFFRLVVLVWLIIAIASCNSALVKKKDVLQWNTDHQEHRYRSKTDLYFQKNQETDKNRLIHKKGTVVAVRLESSDDWIRLRLRDITKSEEQYPGEVGYFFVRDPEIDENSQQAIESLQNYMQTNLDRVP